MALTQEEIRIRAGLDYSRVTAGLTDIRSQVYRLARDVPQKLSGLLKANVYAAAAGLVSEVLPTWDEIWNRVYGVDDAALQRAEEMNQNLKTLRKNVLDSQKQLDKTDRDIRFDEAGPLGKAAILEGELTQRQRELTTAKERLKFAKEHNLDVEKRKEAEIAVNHALTEQLKAEKALRDLQKKFTPAEVRAEFDRKLDATRGQVVRDRRDIAIARDELSRNPNDVLFQQLESEALARINTTVAARRLQSLDFAQNIPDIGPFGMIKDSLVAAQAEAMKNVIQKVSIVEIK